MSESQIGEDSGEPKHITLHNAITRLTELEQHVERIIDKVEGPKPADPKAEVSTKQPQPTLLGILQDGPDRVHNKVDCIGKKLNELEKLLF